METKYVPHASRCARCGKQTCYPSAIVGDSLPSTDSAPEFCPMVRLTGILETARKEYDKPQIREFARLASVQEAECYELTPDGIRTLIPRFEEVVHFCRKCGYTKLGLAFCIGLKKEARIITRLLESKGFEVVSVNCKVGRVMKEDLGLQGHEKIMGADMVEPMCNPIAQAKVLNAEDVDLAIMVGLCVGHDTLFFKYCEVPCTVLAVKDRVMGHNPLAAIYLSDSFYYGRMKSPMSTETVREKPLKPEG